MHVALVTGSTQNIGRAIATRLATDGAAVVINGRDHERAEAVAESLRAQGHTALAQACDVTDRAAVRAMVETVSAQLGPIDVLINNAMVRNHAMIEDVEVGDFEQVLRVVLDGAFHSVQAVLPAMVERGWGRIVNVGGLSGQTGAVGRVAVVTAKSGLMGLTRSIAMEFAEHGVTCNTVSPGTIDTVRTIPAGQEETARAFYADQAAKVPIGRLGRPEEIAAMCAYLCSEEAGFTTGQTFGVNGGAYLWS